MLESLNTYDVKSMNLMQGKMDLTQKNKLVGIPDVTSLEDEFNKTLAQYTKNYQMLMDELITNNKQPTLLKYAGKNIKYGNKYYYVNSYGYAHQYDMAAWMGRSNSCSANPLDITLDEFNTLLKGPNMGNGQDCNIAGYNIQNKSNGEHSWVDIKGVRHIYPNDIWENRSASCQSMPRLLDNDAYTNVPILTSMEQLGDQEDSMLTEKSLCNTLNVDPKILRNLAKLNDKLLTLGKELLMDTNTLTAKDAAVKAQLDKFNVNMMKQLNKLQQDKKQFNNSEFNINNVKLGRDAYNTNISGVKESSEFKLSSNYLQYISWLLITILLILFIFYTYSSTRQSIITLIILVVVALFLLYKFGNYIYYKLF